jgi:hypothetical protein
MMAPGFCRRRRLRRWRVVLVVGLLLGLVQRLVDESQPPGRRLVVLHHQHVPGGQGNYLLKPTYSWRQIKFRDMQTHVYQIYRSSPNPNTNYTKHFEM